MVDSRLYNFTVMNYIKPSKYFVLIFLSATLFSLSHCLIYAKTLYSPIEILPIGMPLSLQEKDISTKSDDVWLGLYKTNNGVSIKKYTIRIKKEGVCEVDDFEDVLYVKEKPKPFLITRGIPDLKEGEIATSFWGRQPIYPGMRINLELNTISYEIASIGNSKMQDKNPELYAEDYKIYFRSNSDAFRLTPDISNYYQYQLIKDFKDETIDLNNGPELIWAGDLDKDGKLDLIIDLSPGLYSQHITLFLSSFATKYEYLHNVAITFSGYDC